MQPLWIIIPTAIAIGVTAFLVSRRMQEKRTEAMRRFARMRGFEFREKDAGVAVKTHLFKQGHRGKSVNALSRDDLGGKVVLFDYRYVRSAGQNSHVHTQTVAAFRHDGRSLPPFELRPENVLDKVASVLGWMDIDFDNRPDFSSAYLLRGPDEAAIRRAFGTAVLAFFEKSRGWSVEAEDPWLLVYRGSKCVKPEELEKFLEEARQVDDAFGTAGFARSS
ncbi:MAG: hypothetical protein U0167_08970 [bacterium]